MMFESVLPKGFLQADAHDPELSLTINGAVSIDSLGSVFINGMPLESFIANAMGLPPVEFDGYRMASFSGYVSISIMQKASVVESADTLSGVVEFV